MDALNKKISFEEVPNLYFKDENKKIVNTNTIKNVKPTGCWKRLGVLCKKRVVCSRKT